MKKGEIIKFVVLFTCLFSLNIYGQRKEITKEEMSDIYKKAVAKTGKLSHRIISESKVYGSEETEVLQIEKGLSEFALPDKFRYVAEIKRVDVGSVFSFESIKIDGVKYERKNKGEWTKQNIAPVQNPSSLNFSESGASFYITENAKLDGRTADLLELKVEYKHQRKNPNTKEVYEYKTYRTERRWIGKDGLLLKIEMIDENDNPKKIISSRTWIYEYDPNIKIEVPIK